MMRRFEGVWPLFLVAALACGDSPSETEPEPDPEPEPTAGEASLQLTLAGEPVADRELHVSRTDGSFQETVVTDADGWATAEIDGEGLFTIDDDGLGFITSIVISPGEELTFALQGDNGPIWVLEPSSVELEGAGYYEYTSCEGQTHPEYSPELYATGSCVDGDGQMDAIALAYSAQPNDGGEVVGYQLASKALSTEALEDTITFSGEWLTDFATISAYVTGLPVGFELGRVEVGLIKGDQVFRSVDFRTYDPTEPVPYVPGFADDLSVLVEIEQSSGSRTSITQLASLGAEYEGSEFLPVMTGSLEASSQPWSLSWAGGADGASVMVLYLDSQDEVGLWRVVGPAGPVTVSLPVLPANVGLSYPESAQFATAYVSTVDFPDAGGYSEASQLGRLSDLGSGRFSEVARRLVRDGQRLRESFTSVSTLDVPASQMLQDRALRELDERLRQRR
ncbi:MAG: hypothetical protein KJO07_19655 [Deltaproteobacteria bacterium]|nr:hypothetical protein [Deltaproteobacteria bacterium]